MTRSSKSLFCVLALSAALAGCASTDQQSRIPSFTDDVTSADGVFSQPVKWSKKQPDCKGQCATLSVDSLVFPGNRELTELVDTALATMTGMGETTLQTSIEDFEQHYWKTAGPRDEVLLAAKTRYRNKDITTLELGSWQYFTGAAHGMSATQFINWDNQRKTPISLEQMLQRGEKDAFISALRQAHTQWLATQEDAIENPERYRRLWPFQPSDNAGITDKGIVVKYNAYEIAPYSSGQPELLIPYSALRGILKPAYLPE
ncbi:DUF3298 domain-containing protein [Alcaligenaceae bacterium 429]|uniref:RsiV family protein n=1 Tax=Paenalcaligenes sp. Me52 TaxID=3392038 RepID=UPI001091C66E|nr:DUF3298 domain-containing protein [Alcaligenaceae bacterium 429]